MNREDAPSKFEILGYFEEIWDAKTRKCIGTRKVLLEVQDRRFGEPGERRVTLMHDIEMTVGHKTQILRASKNKPREIFTRLQPICGRMLKDIHPK
jgi:hypothetical protein